ncbi:hypothetical protein LTR08_003542 [Meristemomyces frigidus]|nr:hypothetical protein LTR08_003542 [Meristemomyces frigidus]
MARSDYDTVEQDGVGEPLDASDEGSDDESIPRTSREVRRHDMETMTTEEEAERLLGKPSSGSRGLFGRVEDDDVRHEARRAERGSKKRRRSEKSEPMYELEEGGPMSSGAESSGHSSEVDIATLHAVQATRKSKGSRLCKFVGVHIVIVAAFIALLFGAYRASQGKRGHEATRPDTPHVAEGTTQNDHIPHSQYRAQSLSNGTHTFAPTTILISLDGFRADFVHLGLTPTLSELIHAGVSPEYMNPSFPSLTFPNHFTLVTGLHPESHGIVGNTFWDPITEKEFYYTDHDRSMQPEWWNAEPLWETTELQGVRTAIHMWPGSEAHIGKVEPVYVDKFNADEKLDNKVHRILGWLDLPGPEGVNAKPESPRPQLIAAYVPNVDADGHKYGPNSTYIRSTIAEVDGMLGQLFTGIEDRNLTQIVNVIIVSDHGMASTSVDRLVQLEDIIDTGLIEHIDGWPLYGLRPYNHSDTHLQDLYEHLLDKSKTSKYRGNFDVYLRDENMPERYHFSDNARIAPLWIVPKVGWAIVTKDEFNVATSIERGLAYHPKGLHGYDNEDPFMRAGFIARGPAFPHAPGSRLEPFQNTEVYNIVCDSLGVTPAVNNGTLRLPLKPSGIHDFEKPAPEILHPPDEQPQAHPVIVSTGLPPEVANLASRPDFMVPTAGIPPVKPTLLDRPTPTSAPGATSPEAMLARPAVHDNTTSSESESSRSGGGWLSWATAKLEAIKAWAGHVFESSSQSNGTAEATSSSVP